MNRDEITRMAREACMALSDKQAVGRNLWSWPMEYQEKPAYREALERFFHAAYAAGAAAEREACAKVCDPEPSLPSEAYTVLNNKATMRRCATAIRARGQQ